MSDGSGFALLAVLVSLSALGLAGLVLSSQVLPSDAGAAAQTEQRLAAGIGGAIEFQRQNGRFPNDTSELASSGFVPRLSTWQRDPFSKADHLVSSLSGSGEFSLASVGPDGLAASGDDRILRVSLTRVLGLSTRTRLRVLRARYLRSPFMDSPMMSDSDRASLAAAVHEYAGAQRSMLHATSVEQVALTAQRDASLASIALIRSSHGLPDPPATVRGFAGLLGALGLNEELATDGFGRDLIVVPVGFGSLGADGVEGTDDDY